MILMVINFRPRTLALLLRKAEMKRSLSVQDVPCVADLLGGEGKKIEDHFQQFSSILSYRIKYFKASYFHNTAFQIIIQFNQHLCTANDYQRYEHFQAQLVQTSFTFLIYIFSSSQSFWKLLGDKLFHRQLPD